MTWTTPFNVEISVVLSGTPFTFTFPVEKNKQNKHIQPFNISFYLKSGGNEISDSVSISGEIFIDIGYIFSGGFRKSI